MAISGARCLTALATRCVKSGLSMMTSRSGFAATTASAVRRMRLSTVGSRPITATMPITAMSSRGNRLFRPCASMAWPPTPPKRSRPSPSLALRARMSFAPSWSPDSSPETIQIVSGPASAMAGLHPGQVHRGEEQAEAIRLAQGLLLLQNEGRACPDGDAGQACACGLGNGSGADGGHVDAKVRALLGGFDQHSPPPAATKAEPGLPQSPHPPQHPVRALGPFYGQNMLAGHDGGLADVEGRQGAQEIEPHGDGPAVVLVRLDQSAQGARRQEFGRELMGSHHPVPALLQQ